MINKCIALFNLLPTSQVHHWLIAADWLEEEGLDITAAAFRENIFVLEITNFETDGYGNGNGRGWGNGYGNGEGDKHSHGYISGNDWGDGHGNGDGSGEGYGWSSGSGHWLWGDWISGLF